MMGAAGQAIERVGALKESALNRPDVDGMSELMRVLRYTDICSSTIFRNNPARSSKEYLLPSIACAFFISFFLIKYVMQR